ncbi:MAG: helix-hairpin-helix domain-containing protein [Pirellulales bacterium]|nr:helix-hairpin-helix domain-containing protein [Pirellulales bacterium]
MGDTAAINLQNVARNVGLPLPKVRATVELLDEGNTVPFITRYRKDQTGGLDEEQIRRIQDRLAKLRLLAERKQTILRSIEAQGKLTESLAKRIEAASTTKRLEDLYLPFKPKKQTLATLARSRGLEELAHEILAANPTCADLDRRAADFVSEDRGVLTAADALLGAGHILAEQFSESAELREKLREIVQRTGKLICTQIVTETKEPEAPASGPDDTTSKPAATSQAEASAPSEPDAPKEPDVDASEPETAAADTASAETPAPEEPAPETADTNPVDSDATSTPAPDASASGSGEPPEGAAPANESNTAAESDASTESVAPTEPETVASSEPAAPDKPEADASGSGGIPEADASSAESAAKETPPKPPAPQAKEKKLTAAQLKKKQAQEKRKQAQEKRLKAFSDYFDYREAVRRVPPHRILAINRGERSRVLRVKIDIDLHAIEKTTDEVLIPVDHPHIEFLRGCARDALARLILPSLEREVRRELTEKAEAHAVTVFARNLRNLLLQPPIHDHRVLAVDPGYRSGCKLVALDQFGNPLGHGVIYLVGKSRRGQKAKETVLDLIDRFKLQVIAIGNGTACRETEDFFAKMLEEELAGRGLAYVIANEAGASVYSTSRLGREEFPDYDATLRGAISIGRRLQDPLSELVKIDPPSIGVGMYQHDVKAKHLHTSLDDVVESCVNYVGVNVNTASTALLRRVSGLNQLTARRLFEHRMQNGPFRNREQLKEVAGLGNATFVQAAGFLKIAGGDQPLDATWIHPESYDVAARVLGQLGHAVEDLADKEKVASLAQQSGQVDVKAMAAEMQVGELLLADILAQLARPGRDPREDLPAPVFKRGILKLEDLTPEMELTGTVLNVVDFGAFVDIGMHDSGLVHISRLANKYVADPHEVVAVGDVVRVWVVEIDKQRRRVSLTMIPPGTPKPERPERQRPDRRKGGKPEGRPAGKDKESRRPSDGKKPFSKRPRGKGRPPAKPSYKPKARPKPFVPITEKMKSGAEPMRTFGDLAQFYELKDDSAKKEEKADAPEAKDQIQDTDQAQDNDQGLEKSQDQQTASGQDTDQGQHQEASQDQI